MSEETAPGRAAMNLASAAARLSQGRVRRCRIAAPIPSTTWFFRSLPSLTLVSLRQLSEAFARHAAARAGLLPAGQDAPNQHDFLRALEQRGIVKDQIAEIVTFVAPFRTLDGQPLREVAPT